MGNSFVTAKLIAERALPILKDQIKFLPLVNRQFDNTFRKAGGYLSRLSNLLAIPPLTVRLPLLRHTTRLQKPQ